jgi:cytochrome c-type biogenesis protein CcmH
MFKRVFDVARQPLVRSWGTLRGSSVSRFVLAIALFCCAAAFMNGDAAAQGVTPKDATAAVPAPPGNPAPLPARQAVPMAADPALEARVMAISEELRCLVCQNETIAASHADLAIDLRKQIRIKLTQGQSQQQILDFMVERYGDFVLYRPPLKANTVLLWVGPFVLLLAAATVLMLNIRRKRGAGQPGALSPDETLRAKQLLSDDPLTLQGSSKP